MNGPTLAPVGAEGGFPVARCRECAKDVLAWPDVDEEPAVWRCVVCDERLPESALAWVSTEGLEALGYEIRSGLPKKTGCSGCSSGGGCGVKKPTNQEKTA